MGLGTKAPRFTAQALALYIVHKKRQLKAQGFNVMGQVGNQAYDLFINYKDAVCGVAHVVAPGEMAWQCKDNDVAGFMTILWLNEDKAQVKEALRARKVWYDRVMSGEVWTPSTAPINTNALASLGHTKEV